MEYVEKYNIICNFEKLVLNNLEELNSFIVKTNENNNLKEALKYMNILKINIYSSLTDLNDYINVVSLKDLKMMYECVESQIEIAKENCENTINNSYEEIVCIFDNLEWQVRVLTRLDKLS